MVPQADVVVTDPLFTTAWISTIHGTMVWESLFAWDSKLQAKPQMAGSWSTSPDGLTWHFTLRDGLRFHDGTPVRAVDCVASLKRWSRRDPFGQLLSKVVETWGAPDDLQEMDWGSVVQRRTNMGPVEQGGWSVFHTYGSSGGYATPATSPLVRGQGKAGWFGWWTSARAEELTQDWLAAPDAASQKRIASELSRLAMAEVATIPLGINYAKTAYRKTITGVLQGVAPYPWNVRPA